MWTFEDIHMLVGSNMPIFGGGRYPAVSLRLRLESETVLSEIHTLIQTVSLYLTLNLIMLNDYTVFDLDHTLQYLSL